MEPILRVRNLCTGYGSRQVLFNVDLDIGRNEVLRVRGGNGSGKSTLLKALFGLLPPWSDRGRIEYRGQDGEAPRPTFPPHRNLSQGIAYLPQKNATFEQLTVRDIWRLVASTASVGSFSSRTGEMVALIPRLRDWLHRRPGTMSGGERRLVALATVLFSRPRLLLLDEPLAGLDGAQARQLEEVLQAAHAQGHMTLVIVEHRRLHLDDLVQRNVEIRLGQLEEARKQ